MTGEQATRRITIVYASQTGQAKIIAETISDQAIRKNIETNLYCISKHDKEFSFNTLNMPLVFVCSTTGDGETPETARKCWHKLKRLDSESNRSYLSNLNYALLGLGDTNYTQFCNGPKSFHKRFLELGANCFYGPSWADDGTDLELEVEPFKDKLWDALDKYFSSKSCTNTGITKIEGLLEERLSLKSKRLVIHDFSADIELTVPDLAECHLSIEFEANNNERSLKTSIIKYIQIIYPQSSQGIFKGNLIKKSLMTTSNAEKDCVNVRFLLTKSFGQISDDETSNKPEFDYEPGHSIDIVCPNNEREVSLLLKRLNVSNTGQFIKIKSLNESKKLGSNYVKLAENGNSISIDLFFKYCVDIRINCLKKSMLRMLASYCTDKEDETKLLELCSKEGSEHYLSIVKENSLTLLDILNTFESCHPSIEHLIQMLPPLTTRSYTLCSYFDKKSENIHQHEMEIIFNLIDFPRNDYRTYERTGVATGYLNELKAGDSFYFLKRKLQNFTFPATTDLKQRPILMIGPGTGIAPFVSFLRSQKMHKEIASESNLWLFYGCRSPFKDFLFKNEILTVFSKMLSNLMLSYSRIKYDELTESGRKDESFNENFFIPNSKYVQDSIKHHSKEIVNLLHDHNGIVYLCGDAKNMSKDVLNCITECFTKELNMTLDEAKKYLATMINTKRYKQDIWA